LSEVPLPGAGVAGAYRNVHRLASRMSRTRGRLCVGKTTVRSDSSLLSASLFISFGILPKNGHSFKSMFGARA
jgi:hypothetical protein